MAQFGTDPLGESVNLVDLPQIQSTVRSPLYGTPAPPAAPAPHPTKAITPQTRATVNVVNASGRGGAARQLLTALVGGRGYIAGQLPEPPGHVRRRLRFRRPRSRSDASGRTRRPPHPPRGRPGPDTLRVIIGTNFPAIAPFGLRGSGAPLPPPATAVSAVGGGRSRPLRTALTDGGIPCVK